MSKTTAKATSGGVSVRVLCDVNIGGQQFQPDDVITGLPAPIAEQYAGCIDPHPDAVAYASAQGADSKQFVAVE